MEIFQNQIIKNVQQTIFFLIELQSTFDDI